MHGLHDALTASGIPLPPANINAVGSDFIRYGKNNRYWLKQADGVTLFGDWVADESYHHFEDGGQMLSPTEIEARREKLAALKRDVETERLHKWEETADRVAEAWERLAATGSSPYLAHKQISAQGVRFEGNTVVVPLRDVTGKLWSLQKIHPDGQKRFFPGGRIAGCFHTIGTLQGAAMVYVVEGYATGASVHLATGCPVIVAFNAGNLEPVVAAIRKAWPELCIIIAADNDQWTEGNPGKTKAGEAARKHGCKAILPHFSDTAGKPTDWNDLHCLSGIEGVKRQLSVTTALKTLVAHTLHDFLSLEIPPRETILAPVIPTQGLAMLYAVRGAGKTYVSLSMALAVATGTGTLGGRWAADMPRRVLYVDGEMPAAVLQERLASLTIGLQKDLPAPDYLRIITPDMQETGIPNLATPEGQHTIEEHLENVELLILDNLSALVQHGKENDAESWVPIQGWLLSLRKRGISVLLVHHANKNGGQRGTSKKEDLLDTVIALKRPDDYDPQHGAQFSVHYEKARGFHGDEAKPFEARLVSDHNAMHWEIKEIEDSQLERVVSLQADGLKQREIAEEMGCSAATVNRLLKRAKAEGQT